MSGITNPVFNFNLSDNPIVNGANINNIAINQINSINIYQNPNDPS